MVPDDQLPNFIKNEDQDREGNGWEPPVDLQRIHLQPFVHARSVGQESSKTSFKDQTKGQDVISHSLLEKRIFPGLADKEIRPLDHHNGHKKGCMASVLKNLSVLVGPLLTVGIF